MKTPDRGRITAGDRAARLKDVQRAICIWMAGRLAITAAVALQVAATPAVIGSLASNQLLFFGQFLFMGLIGLVLASLVGICWHNAALQHPATGPFRSSGEFGGGEA